MPRLPYLRVYRERALLTQVELAERAGIAQSQIVRIEQGKSAYNETVRKLAAALDIEPTALMERVPALDGDLR